MILKYISRGGDFEGDKDHGDDEDDGNDGDDKDSGIDEDNGSMKTMNVEPDEGSVNNDH